MTEARIYRALLLVLVVGAGLRLFGLMTWPYEQDELYTAHESTYLFASRLQPGIESRPLYFLMQHAILTVVPPSPLSLRILPFVFGLTGIWLTWLLASRMLGPSAGLVAAILTAVSPWHMYASGFARYYAMLFALAAAVYVLLPRAYDRDGIGDYLAVLTLLLLGAATHPSFAFPVIGVVIAVTLVRADGAYGWRWPSRRGWLYLWGPFAAALLAGYLALRFSQNESSFRNWGGRGTLATLRLVPAMIQWMTPTMFVAGSLGAVLMAFGPRRELRRWGWMALLGGAATIVSLLALSAWTDIYADYATAVLPLVFASAGGLVQLGATSLRTERPVFLWMTVAVLLAGVLPSTVSHLSDGTRFDYRPAYRKIGEEAPGVAVLTQPLVLQREYAPALRALQLRPRRAYLDSVLAAERDVWAVVSLQRYGILGDGNGELARWLADHCRLRDVHEGPRYDYRTYRVDLYRCSATLPGGGAITSKLPPSGRASSGLSVGFTPAGAVERQSGYRPVAADDWKRYGDSEALRALPQWFSFREQRFRVRDHVDLVPDRTFGQVARITQPADQDPRTPGGFSPEFRQMLPTPLDNVWFRPRVRFSPGWTTAGPNPPGWANSYKLAFILWKDADGRAQIEFSNTSQYILGAGVQKGNCREARVPGSQSFGHVTTEWTGGEWWEFVMHYQRMDRRTFRAGWWRRQLTRGGAIVNSPFTYVGEQQTCDSAPEVRGVALGANKNKATPVTQYVHWGPWEIVDGSAYVNPFDLPGYRP